MGFFSALFGTPNHDGVTANANDPLLADPASVGEPDWNPGDPDGLELQFDDVESRSLPGIFTSPWSGWPDSWSTPNWGSFGSQFGQLVDTAWACFDLNSRILSTMPVYRTRDGRIIQPTSWMTNPDSMIYTSWHEFAKQLFWDYQLGEAFVLPMARTSSNLPHSFRVIPPWLVNVEMGGGGRVYNIGAMDVTNDILHIRYKSTTDSAHGIGPLDAAGARLTAAAVLTKYVAELVSSGGVPYLTLETDFKLTKPQADELREQWVKTRLENIGKPAVLHTGVKAVDHQMSPKDMAMLEISQFTEARIATLCGVPPFLIGLTLPGSSETYSNVLSLFDFHDRSFLKPTATSVMSAVSDWALPRGQAIELNRDEYSRPALKDRVESYVKLASIIDPATGQPAISVEEIRSMERLLGDAPRRAAAALAGADTGGAEPEPALNDGEE